MSRIDRSAASGDGGSASASMRWLLAIAAAGALIGWQVLRQVRARSRSHGQQHDLHRWEGEGGQVLD